MIYFHEQNLKSTGTFCRSSLSSYQQHSTQNVTGHNKEGANYRESWWYKCRYVHIWLYFAGVVNISLTILLVFLKIILHEN